jgi:hypothetical protein
MVWSGSSELSGSWGTNPISLPRNGRQSRSANPVTSRLARAIDPPVTSPRFGSSPAAARAIVDFPDPDCPTSASVRPRDTESVTPWTTSMSWCAGRYATRRSRISRAVDVGASTAVSGAMVMSGLPCARP